MRWSMPQFYGGDRAATMGGLRPPDGTAGTPGGSSEVESAEVESAPVVAAVAPAVLRAGAHALFTGR